MLFKIFKVDDTSKTTACKVAIFNLILTFLLNITLIGVISVLFEFDDKVTAGHISRLIWVEVILNFLFYPFAIVLLLGVKKDNYKWIRIWIKAKVVQASYILLLNLVMQVYVSASISIGDGLIVLAYTLIVEVFYMDHIIFMNNYHRHKESEEDDSQLKETIPESVVIRF
ncbi:hypothetical protein Zmor_010887 [Zophobas morio]|uniref:Uncharacterized protein n=1 Tax=Zophobas morio TaxID=2755281 RepID=A0AA38MKE8_9CUCU|nr:hypothetical protein Zmor_010887 [Zophobas morio]